MSHFFYALTFALAGGLSLYLVPLVREGALRFKILDRPDGSLKTHEEPTPYLGGLAIAIAFLLALTLTYEFRREVLGLLLASSVVLILGLLDDFRVLTPRIKFLGQIAAVIVLAKADITLHLVFLPEWLNLGLSALWLLAVINAINLIDIMDGLAGGVACVAGSFFFVIALLNGDAMIATLTAALVGATLGFLHYNLPKARIFMGDTGSMFIGLLLGALALIGQYTAHNRLGALAPAAFLFVPLFDTVFVMGVRWRKGLPVFLGSPDHYALRLLRLGWSVRQVLALSYGVGALAGACGLVMVFVEDLLAGVLVLGLLVAALVAGAALILAGRRSQAP